MSEPISVDRKVLRKKLFRNLEGFPVVACTAVLAQKGLLKEFVGGNRISLNELSQQFNANSGYLAVALRIMASQGWLTQEVMPNGADRYFQITSLGESIFEHSTWFEMAYCFFPTALKFDDFLEEKTTARQNEIFQTYFDEVEKHWEIVPTSSLSFLVDPLNGIVLGPLLVALGMRGEIDKWKSQKFIISKKDYQGENWRMLFDFFEHFQWVTKKRSQLIFSEEAIFFLKRASAYGVTVSYLQTYIWLNELIFGKADVLWDRPAGSPEIHVDRTMNVWGSGGAHAVYFQKIDEMIIELFNKPIDQQPKGIADMGCGNGALLSHLYHTIVHQTSRGKQLEDFPLLVIGSDFNQAAIEASKINLENDGVKAHLLRGDIGDPKALADQLQKEFQVDLGEMLNVRSFLDHNRVFETPTHDFSTREAIGSGAFSFRGRRIPNNEIEQNLYEHFLKWKPYVKKYGLLVIELHTIAPEIAAKNIGKTAITAYDSTHGFTDQFIVEHEVFIAIAKEAGLHPKQDCVCEYPNEKMPVVSINLLKEK